MLFDLSHPLEEKPIPDQWLIRRMRIRRNELLAQSDWSVLADAPTEKTLWLQYRQTLRDFPETWVISETAQFPDPPAEGNTPEPWNPEGQ